MENNKGMCGNLAIKFNLKGEGVEPKMNTDQKQTLAPIGGEGVVLTLSPSQKSEPIP